MGMKEIIKIRIKIILFYIFRIFPLRNKVVATTMRGRKYGDNPQFIFESLHKKCPELDFVWLVNNQYPVNLPVWVRKVLYYTNDLRLIYELSTAKVWINTHRYERFWRKRPGQLVIETWHGGLGLKKIEGDVEKVRQSKRDMEELASTCNLADMFITQSDHLCNIYKRAFGYRGIVWKCGYPKNDGMFCSVDVDKLSFKKKFNLVNKKIALYAPTMREGDQDAKCPTLKPYSIDWDRLVNSLKKKFGGEWIVFVKWHPVLANTMPKNFINNENVIDVTKEQDMQLLIKSSDLMISDYSSCIFDGALLLIPCFTYATDFDEYKVDRGVYYEMEELPFPYAKNNDELEKNIEEFDYDKYLLKWSSFKKTTGLYESGHASQDIADKIITFINCGRIVWNSSDILM